MLAIVAYIVTLLLYVLIAIVATLYTWVKAIVFGIKQRSFKVYWTTMWQWCYQSAWGLDQAGSPLLSHLGNDLMIKPNGVRLGSPDKTLSHYFGINKINETLYWFGMLIALLIDVGALLFGDKNHTTKAAKKEQYND